MSRRFANNPEGHAALIAWLRDVVIVRVALEPTGTHHRVFEHCPGRGSPAAGSCDHGRPPSTVATDSQDRMDHLADLRRKELIFDYRWRLPLCRDQQV